MIDRPWVVFRADGNASIGLGHVVRCLALADMLNPIFQCLFAIREPAETLYQQVQAVCTRVLTIPTDMTLEQEPAWLQLHLQPTDVLVLDGYHFNLAYQQALKQVPRALVYLDDLLAHSIQADVVLNQAGGISAAAYAQLAPGAELCLGPEFALLRRPFQAARPNPERLPTERIFLNMGGADPENHTLAILHQLRQHFPASALEVVVGAAYPHYAALALAVRDFPLVCLQRNLDAEALAKLLATCGLMVCPPSGMAYECCAIGGLLLLHPIADNQRTLFTFLTEAGLALPFTELATLTAQGIPELANQMMQRQRLIFDGRSGERLRQVFSGLATAYSLVMRRATAADGQQYFDWANNTEVRQNAVHSEPILWETHLAWFQRRLADPQAYLYIFEYEGQAVGQVRVEFEAVQGVIDYSVGAAWRGRGFGVALLRRTLDQLRRERDGAWSLVGQVKAHNLPSCRVFERLGFARQTPVVLGTESYEVFRLDFVEPVI